MLKLVCLVFFALVFCHVNASPLESRIIGGGSDSEHYTPYLVSIRYKKNDTTTFEHRCAGTIYSLNVVLTTATCLVGLQSHRLHIKAGSNSRTQMDGRLYLVEKYLIHPDYNIWFTDNDLALVKLAFNLTTAVPKEIAPIAVADVLPKTGSLATIAGWGSTNASSISAFSEDLQETEVSIVETAECKAAYGEERITPAMFCAGGEGKDACLGDAGGPLVYGDKVAGLISWGSGCGRTNFPGVYTNLVSFRSWIEDEAKKL